MHPLRKKLNKNPVVKFLASIKITVVCLVLLFILTLWGTIDQVSSGLYLAQERFFNSWAFTFWGFIPFPGARLVLWVLFINLSCAAAIRLVYRWSKAGLIISHFGLLIFFVAAFVTFHGAKEGQITLLEGEASNVSQAYHNWELSVWTQEGDKKHVVAFDADHLKQGQKLVVDQYGFIATVKSYYRNCDAYGNFKAGRTTGVLNNSGIQELKALPLDIKPEQNSPGGIFHLEGADEGEVDILLFGGEPKPMTVVKDGQTYYIALRHKHFPMPFMLKLKDFMMELHPNTDMARSYQSLVEVVSRGVSREVLISMNEPLRHKSFTFYQSSYSIDNLGQERSTLAVVKNSGRLLPYIATFVTFAGLAVHFLIMAFQSKKSTRGKKK